MIITVASGKGGTGKTTVGVSLALSLAALDGAAKPLFVDCDVEEPNAALFLKPVIEESRRVGQMIPEVDLDACTLCGRCAEVCQYNAIAVAGENVLVFPELCHACGSCALNCPTDAIDEVLDVMGTIERGSNDRVEFAHGILDVGEMMAPPVISQLKEWVVPPEHRNRPIILDAPPGNACPVVEVLHGSDFVLLVTEPTPFGLHDLRQAVEVARDEMGLPVAVIVNRQGVGDQGVEAYCEAEGIPILLHIPLERRIAEAYSDGTPLVEAAPEYVEAFQAVYRDIEQLLTGDGSD